MTLAEDSSPDRQRLGRLMETMPAAGVIPRRDQDLSFDHPWEIRAFGLAVAASEAGHFDWPEFQAELIAVIRRWENDPATAGDEWRYYERWMEALQNLVVGRGMVATDELERRAADFAPGGPLDPKHRRQ